MILTCGEALYDVFADDDPAAGPFAIAARGVVGGSPLNVALGLSRLGTPSGMFTRLSTDALGVKLRDFLAANGVSDRYCVTTSSEQTTFVLIKTRPDGQPDYAIYCHGTADCSMQMSDLPGTLADDVTAIHLGSFAMVLEPTGLVARALAKREADRRFIAYDPNIRAMVEPDMARWRAMNDDLMPISNLVKASEEDLGMLYPGRPVEEFAERAIAEGADLAIVTRGADGALIASADGRTETVPGIRVTVQDTVGAGDTFQAATLHYLSTRNALKKGLARTVDIGELGRFAVRAAALTCTRRGADLPTLAEVEAFAG